MCSLRHHNQYVLVRARAIDVPASSCIISGSVAPNAVPSDDYPLKTILNRSIAYIMFNIGCTCRRQEANHTPAQPSVPLYEPRIHKC